MTYTKPEVAVLGKAAVVIETTVFPKNSPVVDNMKTGTRAVTSAYDLDE
jgi:hypothetical protein